MEVKKNPKVDLNRKTFLFLNIGFIISLVIVISAFQYKFRSQGNPLDLVNADENFDETIDVPPTEINPPPPPKIVQPKIIEVPDTKEIEKESKINIDIEANEATKVAPEAFQQEPLPAEKTDEIFTIVEDQPSPVGGMNDFYIYISKNLNYPAQARRMGIEGKVYVQFVVDKDGALTDIKAIKGIGGGCDEEAVRVIKEAPKWNPGKQRGQPVKVRMILPIVFKLG